ncbi:9949_t:CDS:2, partial [Dentiscutata heterogama]
STKEKHVKTCLETSRNTSQATKPSHKTGKEHTIKSKKQLQRKVARNDQRFEIKKRRDSLIAITEKLTRHNMKRKLVQKKGRGVDLQEKREDRRLRDRTRQEEAE